MLPFIALEVLIEPNWQNLGHHSCHDLESILYVILYHLVLRQLYWNKL
jgi:hypothetical protein